jgi:hypothetical protein
MPASMSDVSRETNDKEAPTRRMKHMKAKTSKPAKKKAPAKKAAKKKK